MRGWGVGVAGWGARVLNVLFVRNLTADRIADLFLICETSQNRFTMDSIL